jgi:phosphinothricin acetyltransferase
VESLVIRPAIASDLALLTEIYNYYIDNTHIAFDTEPMSVQDYKPWFDKYSLTGPYRLFIAELNGEVVGSAGSRQYRDHPAFIETVEFGIYLTDKARGKGVGKKLYAALFDALKTEKVHLVVAGVALPNPASVALHKSMGFSPVGVFDEYAQKHGKYISSMWFQKRV